MKVFWLLLISIIIFDIPVIACDCDGEELSVNEAFANSKSVFTGKVKSIKGVRTNKSHPDFYAIEFEVLESYKHISQTNRVEILTEATDCGGDFQIGDSYLIYTFWNEEIGQLQYHQCFKMLIGLANAKQEIQKIRGLI